MGRGAFHHLLVWATAALAVLILIGAIFIRIQAPAMKEGIGLADLPIIGRPSAKVQLVLIEDYRCRACRKFSIEVFPEIERRYIDTGEAKCLFVPVAFLHGSKPLANAAIAVYEINPDRFSAYSRLLFETFGNRTTTEPETEELVSLAATVGGIDLKELRERIQSQRYYKDLDRNLEWARKILEGAF